MIRQWSAVRGLVVFLGWLVTLTAVAQEPDPPAAPLPELADSRPGAAVEQPTFKYQGQFDYTYLGNTGRDDFIIKDIDLSATLAMPLAPKWSSIQMTPAFSSHLWQGPDSAGNPANPDVPAQLYDVSLDLGWRHQFAEWLFTDLGITPGWYGEPGEFNGDSFRLRGRALSIVAFSEQWQIVAGVLYVNRLHTKLLPAGGLLWTPNEDFKMELVFPRPKISTRLGTLGFTQWWAYMAGEFGGGTWAVDNQGVSDELDYRDLRLLAGLEWVSALGFKAHFELGYVFGRTLELAGTGQELKPGDCAMLRAGMSF